ncbi:MFS transporter [Liquorilactobacillus oeni]|uniref:Major facilitator superfamily permease n=1 Tax=Liquorilactobacillus oeni DSM 19972 TaxID=1423777 RepID=A0A0R1MGD2_9LACO|nr:MFS transporter [Liquorilactobacillus oeni]KRL04421.1 major facilitator superfamily permease [Liquorilactobacillus oeni DSM 19972]
MKNEVGIKTNFSLAAVGILTFVGILVETSMNVTFPTLMKNLDESLGTVQWLTTGYLLMVTLTMGTTSFLLKRFRKRTLFLYCIGISVTGILFCLWSPNFWVLLAGRLLQASSTGISTPLMFSIIFSEIPLVYWGTYSGFAAMLISLAPALGPTYGGIMNHYLSWRAIFGFALLLVLVSFLLGIFSLKADDKLKKSKFDFWGFVFLSLFLILLEVGVQQLSINYLRGGLLLLCGVVTLIFFIRHAQRRANPLIDLQIFKNKYLMLRLVNYFTLQLVNISMSFVIPLFAENVLHENSLTAGLVLLPGSILGAFIAPFAGRWYDHAGPHRPLLVSNLLVVAGMLLFSLFVNWLTIMFIGLFFIVMRLGFNTGFGNTMSDASKAVTKEQKNDQNSLFSMSQQYAGSIGTAIMAAIIGLQEKINAGRGFVIGSRFNFIFLLAFSLFALACTLFLNKTEKQEAFKK